MTWMGRTRDAFDVLRPAEERLVAEMASGMIVAVGPAVPPEDAPAEVSIRASFLRYLALGGCDACRPPEKGVRVRGAFIEGDGPLGAETRGLDLEGCKVKGDLGLIECRFPDVILANSAAAASLFFNHSYMEGGLQADRLEASGNVSLSDAVVTAAVLLRGARLGGDLDCDRAVLRVEDAEGSVYLRKTNAFGDIRLLGARLGGSLFCRDGLFSALTADRLETKGAVHLVGVVVERGVRLNGAIIGGDVACHDGTFLAERDEEGRPGFALKMESLESRGALLIRDHAYFDGVLSLAGATVVDLSDQWQCWPEPGQLILDGFQYRRIVAGPVDAASRLNWLARQEPARWGDDLWPQPYQQLAKVLREMGHEEDARSVLVEKERAQRAVRRARATRGWRRLLAVWDGMLDRTIRFGQQPLRAFAFLGAFWLTGFWVFGLSATQDAIKPSSPVVLRSPEWVLCNHPRTERVPFGATGEAIEGRAAAGQSQRACYRSQPEAASYPGFNAFVYSLDTLLPVASLQQQEFWVPDGTKRYGGFAWAYLWVHILAGWALSLLAVAGFSGLVKSD